MRRQLTILGGSTPFTASLLDALATEKDLPSYSLVLYGRNLENLSLIGRYAALRLEPLGWSVHWTTNIAEALAGSHIVVQQIRYGDMAGRARDEEVSLSAGVPPDETLGPGALLSALRQGPHLDLLAKSIKRYCPDVWLLNLTNPLSTVVHRLSQQGVENCIGLCELPRVTVRQAAAVLGENTDLAQWAYAGLNHRGFVVGLSWNGRDRTMDLANKLGKKTMGGVSGDDIMSLKVIPTKYFGLYRQPQVGSKTKRRAHFLDQLRKRIITQMRHDSNHSPPALHERYLAWYPDAVVPMIKALSSLKASLQEINRVTSQGLVEEGRARVSKAGVGPLLPAPVGPEASRWLDQFRRHELAVISAMEHPGRDTIARALELDPIMPEDQIEPCSRQIWNDLNKRGFTC